MKVDSPNEEALEEYFANANVFLIAEDRFFLLLLLFGQETCRWNIEGKVAMMLLCESTNVCGCI